MTAITNNTAIYGGGATTVAHVLAVQFPNANLASHPILEAYDTLTPSLAVTNASAVNADALFKKTSGNVPENSALIACATREFVGTPNSVPASWWTGADFGNSPAYPANAGRARKLYGQTSSLQLLPDAEALTTPADKVTFNLTLRTGPNTPDTAGQLTHYLVVRVTYTGGVNPRCVFLGNTASVDTPAGAVFRALSGEDPDLVSYSGSPAGSIANRRLLHGNTGTNPADPQLTRPSSGNLFSGALVAKE